MRGLTGFKRNATHQKHTHIKSSTPMSLSLNLNLSDISNFNIKNPSDSPDHPVLQWNDKQVAIWLRERGLSAFEPKFRAHDINGEVLFELNHSLLKMMQVPTVGARVKILEAIKELKRKQDFYSKPDAPRKINSIPISSSNSSSGPTAPNKLSPLGTFGALLKRSKTHLESPNTPDTRTFQDSEIKLKNHLHLGVSSPPSPEVSKFDLGSLLSFSLIHQNCVRIFGNDGQSRVVQIGEERDATAILKKILHKFNISEDPSRYAIFIVSGDSARSLTNEELVDLTKRSDRSKLFLRKKHFPINHEEFRKNSFSRISSSNSSPRLETPTPVASPKQVKLTKIFGTRPPTELIDFNHETSVAPDTDSHISICITEMEKLTLSARPSPSPSQTQVPVLESDLCLSASSDSVYSVSYPTSFSLLPLTSPIPEKLDNNLIVSSRYIAH